MSLSKFLFVLAFVFLQPHDCTKLEHSACACFFLGYGRVQNRFVVGILFQIEFFFLVMSFSRNIINFFPCLNLSQYHRRPLSPFQILLLSFFLVILMQVRLVSSHMRPMLQQLLMMMFCLTIMYKMAFHLIYHPLINLIEKEILLVIFVIIIALSPRLNYMNHEPIKKLLLIHVASKLWMKNQMLLKRVSLRI